MAHCFREEVGHLPCDVTLHHASEPLGSFGCLAAYFFMPTKEWVRGKSTVVTIGPLQNSARYGMPRQVSCMPTLESKHVDWPLSKSMSSVIGKSGPTSSALPG